MQIRFFEFAERSGPVENSVPVKEEFGFGILIGVLFEFSGSEFCYSYPLSCNHDNFIAAIHSNNMNTQGIGNCIVVRVQIIRFVFIIIGDSFLLVVKFWFG